MMAEINTHASNLRLVGGRLCLDFVNTANNHHLAEPKEHLTSYPVLLAWARHAGALDGPATARLEAEARRRPADAVAELDRARELRAALYALLGPGGAVDPALASFNRLLARLPAGGQLDQAVSGLAWSWGAGADPLGQPVYPVIWSAAELLTAPERALVRQCAGPGCTWLFLDTSRNHTRRWCSMEDCGNRAKAQRHYARQRGQP
jgi:predicted RNA-binding Zn ribbon-like protein